MPIGPAAGDHEAAGQIHGQHADARLAQHLQGRDPLRQRCTLGDIVAETFTLAVPLSLFGHHVFGTWALDFCLAFLFGVAFQYFSIKPMRNLSPSQGLVASLKADTLSLIAWQLGMHGWMALCLFVWFSEQILLKTSAAFWFMMQIAMLCGLVVAYPVNAWLIRKGIKEAM